MGLQNLPDCLAASWAWGSASSSCSKGTGCQWKEWLEARQAMTVTLLMEGSMAEFGGC